MNSLRFSPKVLSIAGLVMLIVGIIDPLEGSVVIVLGSILAFAGATVGRSAHRRLLLRAMILIVIGVALMIGISAMGGLGGDTGRSVWWSLLLIPYPVGWVMAVVGSIKLLGEIRRAAVEAGILRQDGP